MTTEHEPLTNEEMDALAEIQAASEPMGGHCHRHCLKPTEDIEPENLKALRRECVMALSTCHPRKKLGADVVEFDITPMCTELEKEGLEDGFKEVGLNAAINKVDGKYILSISGKSSLRLLADVGLPFTSSSEYLTPVRGQS